MTEAIKKELPETKFIFISCFNDFNYIRDAMKLEAYAYVLKPINLEELTQAIRKVKDLRLQEIERELTLHAQKKKLKDSLPLLQEQFFRDIINGRLKDEKVLYEQAEYLELVCMEKRYVILFVELDNCNQDFANSLQEQRYLLIECVKQSFKKYLKKLGQEYILNHQLNNFTIILFEDKIAVSFSSNTIVEVLNECKTFINETFKVSITIGISDFSDTLQEMLELFKRAEYSVKSKFYSTGNRIIIASEVKEPESILQYNLQDIKNELISVIEEGDAEVFVERHIKNHINYNESYIKGLSYTIINVLQTILLDRNENFADIFGNAAIIWDKLARFETIIDIKLWLINVINAVKQHTSRYDGNRYKSIVEEIKEIIDKNYMHNNINDLLKPLYISTSHANRIFKQLTGKTIFDYLIQYRIEVAKEMLTDAQIKVYEVAEKVGYVNISYFGSLFKEYTGLTPKQYMDRYSK